MNATALVLGLKWSVKDRLVNNLNQQSRILCAKVNDDQVINSVLEDSHDLVRILCGLKSIDKDGESTNFDEQKSDDPILELGWQLKNQLINNISEHQIILDDPTISNAVKVELIRENKFLIKTLTDLKIRDGEFDLQVDLMCEKSQTDSELKMTTLSKKPSTEVKPDGHCSTGKVIALKGGMLTQIDENEIHIKFRFNDFACFSYHEKIGSIKFKLIKQKWTLRYQGLWASTLLNKGARVTIWLDCKKSSKPLLCKVNAQLELFSQRGSINDLCYDTEETLDKRHRSIHLATIDRKTLIDGGFVARNQLKLNLKLKVDDMTI